MLILWPFWQAHSHILDPIMLKQTPHYKVRGFTRGEMPSRWPSWTDRFIVWLAKLRHLLRELHFKKICEGIWFCPSKAWPTVFAKVVILLYPLMVWVTPDRRSLRIIRGMKSEWVTLASCIRWIILAKKIIDLTQFWKRRLTFSSSCMQTTSWMLPAPLSCKPEAPLLIPTQLLREFLFQEKLYRSNSHFHSAGCASL